MKCRHKIAVVAISLLICLTASAFLLTACNDDPAFDYASATNAWDSAPNKMSTDTGSVEALIGSGENAVPVTVELEGIRAYIGNEMRMEYTVTVKGLRPFAGNPLTEGLLRNPVTVTISASKTADGNYSLSGTALGRYEFEAKFSQEELTATIPNLDLAASTFYGTDDISGDASSYTIPGNSSLDWILSQVAPILAYDAGYDIMPMIYDWVDFGDVTGNMTFRDGVLASMTTSQDIEAFMPYEDAEFLAYNVEFFPRMLYDLIESKRITLASVVTLDFSDVITDGIRISGTVSTRAEYTILPDDATFADIFPAD